MARALMLTNTEVAMTDANTTENGEKKVTKSIVPAKYAGMYKDGGSDALAKFINEECKGTDGFDYIKFFDLCRENGLPEDKVNHYAEQVESKRLGSQGRARMTLRNMLATIARKTGELKGLDGEPVSIVLPKVALAGAAAKAKAEQETASH
jgi:hypothetical protein